MPETSVPEVPTRSLREKPAECPDCKTPLLARQILNGQIVVSGMPYLKTYRGPDQPPAHQWEAECVPCGYRWEARSAVTLAAAVEFVPGAVPA